MNKTIEVVAAVIVKNNLIFCAQRPNKGETALKWEFPGGKIEANETRDKALIREIKEELDSEISVDDFLMTVEHEYKSFILVMHVFKCSLLKGTLQICEHVDSKWVHVKELKDIDFAEADIKIVKYLEEKFM